MSPHPSRAEIIADHEQRLPKLELSAPREWLGADGRPVAIFDVLRSRNPGNAPVEGSPALIGEPCETACAGMPTAQPFSAVERERALDDYADELDGYDQ